MLTLVRATHTGTTTGPPLACVQAAGFPVGGENLAIDLADTIVMVSSPPTELLPDQATCDRFWALHHAVLPPGWAFPTLAATRTLRAALRAALDAAQQDRSIDAPTLDRINATCALATTSFAAVEHDDALTSVERWHFEDAKALTLAATARSAIEILTSPSLRSSLRRCANPNCSMLFVNGDARRRFCTPNICGNRHRVAQHYLRHRHDKT